MRRGPLRHKWFAAFTAATGLGGVADEVARLALPLLVLDITHSIAAADRAARIIGPTLGGFAIAAIGNVSAMWIAALAFLPTLALFYLMPPILEISAAQLAPLTVRNVVHEIGDGFAFVWRLKVLRWL